MQIITIIHSGVLGSTPIDAVFNNVLNMLVFERLDFFVTGVEVENLTKTASVSDTTTEDIAVLEPGCKYYFVGLRDIEGLTI